MYDNLVYVGWNVLYFESFFISHPLCPILHLSSLPPSVPLSLPHTHHPPPSPSHALISHTSLISRSRTRGATTNTTNNTNLTGMGAVGGGVERKERKEMEERDWQQEWQKEWAVMDVQICLSRELRQRVLVLQVMQKPTIYTPTQPRSLPPLSALPLTYAFVESIQRGLVSGGLALSTCYRAGAGGVCRVVGPVGNRGFDGHFIGVFCDSVFLSCCCCCSCFCLFISLFFFALTYTFIYYYLLI